MSSSNLELGMNELEKIENERELRKISGKAQHIEINTRTIDAYKEEFAKKGLVITKEEEYPQEDFHLVAKQKRFDGLVDPSQGIRKVIESMIRQPVTIFDKNGKPETKDALYYSGYWYGVDKRGIEIGAPFREGYYKKPKLSFIALNTGFTKQDYDEQGVRRGEYKPSTFTYEHYIYLPEDKKERRKILEDIVSKATGTFTGNLSNGHLSYRNPSPNNDHSGVHGGLINWDNFCDLSIEQLGELQNKNYFTDDNNILRDKDGIRVAYDPSTKKVESTKDR
jgi:hypothetical protein